MSRTTQPITDNERRAEVQKQFYERRRKEYNTWLESLTPYQIRRICHAKCPYDNTRSMEEYLNEQYEAGLIQYSRLGVELAMILA